MIFKQTTFTAEESGFNSNSQQDAVLTFKDGKVVVPKFETGKGFFTNFGEYRNTFPKDGYTTKLTVYIDPTAINAGEGFTFSSAINDVSGKYLTEQTTHIRKISASDASGTNDYNVVFDYSQYAGKVLIGSQGGKLNSQVTNPYTNEFEYSATEITKADWYTISTTYTTVNNEIFATVSITDSKNATIYTATPELKSPTADQNTYKVENLGGNRYGWFTFNTVESGLEVKEISLYNL